MNEGSQWRLELAQEITTWYQDQPGIKMIVLGGSAADGVSDAYSDIDIVIYWDTINTTWLETPPLPQTSAERFLFAVTVPKKVHLEQYWIGNVKADIAHVSLRWWNEITTDVMKRLDTDPDKQGTLGGFLGSIVLYGETVYAKWQKRIAAYPDALAQKVINENLFFMPGWILEHHGVGRGDYVDFYYTLLTTIKRIVGVLAGVNRVYVAVDKPKRINQILGRMKYLPIDAAARITRLLTMDPHEAPAALDALIEDVLAVVATHMPETDLSGPRRAFEFAYKPAEEKPPFRPKSELKA